MVEMLLWRHLNRLLELLGLFRLRSRVSLGFFCIMVPGALSCGSSCGLGELHTPKKPVGSTLRADLVHPSDGAQESTPVPAREVILNATIVQARRNAQVAVLGPKVELVPDPRPLPLDGILPGGAQDPNGQLGFFVPLEPREQAGRLAAFEEALDALEKGEREQPLRLAFYGASGVAADLWTGYIRHYLQSRFGSAGPGIVSAAKPTRWYRHQELLVESSKHWTRHAYRRKQVDDEFEPAYFGVMGQAMSASSKRAWTRIKPGARARTAPALAWYEVHYLKQKRGGQMRVRIDGKLVKKVSTSFGKEGAPGELGVERIDLSPLPPGPHELRIELVGDGEVFLLGVVAETGTPGIVLDTLGVNSAKVENQKEWASELWEAHVQLRAPVLYAFAFGNNESAAEEIPLATFEADFRAMLVRFERVLPHASCVVISPGDFPIVDPEDQSLSPRPRQAQIIAIEERLSREFRCMFLDMQAVMGGAGGKARWVEAGLAQADHLHLTRRGYVLEGMAIADALLWEYDHARSGAE